MLSQFPSAPRLRVIDRTDITEEETTPQQHRWKNSESSFSG